MDTMIIHRKQAKGKRDSTQLDAELIHVAQTHSEITSFLSHFFTPPHPLLLLLIVLLSLCVAVTANHLHIPLSLLPAPYFLSMKGLGALGPLPPHSALSLYAAAVSPLQDTGSLRRRRRRGRRRRGRGGHGDGGIPRRWRCRRRGRSLPLPLFFLAVAGPHESERLVHLQVAALTRCYCWLFMPPPSSSFLPSFFFFTPTGMWASRRDSQHRLHTLTSMLHTGRRASLEHVCVFFLAMQRRL